MLGKQRKRHWTALGVKYLEAAAPQDLCHQKALRCLVINDQHAGAGDGSDLDHRQPAFSVRSKADSTRSNSDWAA